MVSAGIVGLLMSGEVTVVFGIESPVQSGPSCLPPAQVPGNTPTPRDFLYIFIFVNSKAGTEFLVPANFTIPADTLVKVTVDDYDTGASAMDPAYARVCGTVNGTIVDNGHEVCELNLGTIAHTMTITNGTYAGFNVPIPAANATSGVPAQITFSVYFSVPGQYRWECKASCSQTPMSLDGRMSGTITVRGG